MFTLECYDTGTWHAAHNTANPNGIKPPKGCRIVGFDKFEKKKEAWRISSLKRHAEQNKLEQALKVSQTNESLLKKKADMLELTVMSHQKSMDKGRASIVREQLKEHNERLEQQTAIKDLHANATQRKTFQETFSRQMGALDKKLSTLQ